MLSLSASTPSNRAIYPPGRTRRRCALSCASPTSIGRATQGRLHALAAIEGLPGLGAGRAPDAGGGVLLQWHGGARRRTAYLGRAHVLPVGDDRPRAGLVC